MSLRAMYEAQRREQLAALRAVAESHDDACDAELRGPARSSLGLGECEEWRGCPYRGSCRLCGTAWGLT